MRVKRGVAARAKHKKILKAAEGMQHNRTRSFRLAKQGVIRALQYAYRDRRNKKRDTRPMDYPNQCSRSTRRHNLRQTYSFYEI